MLKNNSSRIPLSGANKVPVMGSTGPIRILSYKLTFYWIYYLTEDEKGNEIKVLIGFVAQGSAYCFKEEIVKLGMGHWASAEYAGTTFLAKVSLKQTATYVESNLLIIYFTKFKGK
jgi:hypothetical protein